MIRSLGRMERVPYNDRALQRIAEAVYGRQLADEDMQRLAEHYGDLQGYWAHTTSASWAGSCSRRSSVFFALVYGSVEIARRLAPRYRPVEGVDVLEVIHESAHVWTRRLGLVVATLGALIAGSSAAGAWLLVARYLDGVPFGVRDPIFHNDLSLYVFRLPLWQGVIAWLFGAP